MACSLSVNITGITGDCTNSALGSFSIEVIGTAPNYTFNWTSPYTGSTVLTSTTYTVTGLTANTYTFYINDSCTPFNSQTQPTNVYISSGTCVSILSTTNTTCNLPTGTLIAQNQYSYGLNSFYLYENILGLVQQIDTTQLSNQVTFIDLAPGTYYVIGDDGGGCTGKSESCIIKSSTTLNFGLYIQNTTDCGVNTGAMYITGLTGTPPYIYNWSNGSNGQSITGLTEGDYSVTVQDSTGCITVQGAAITKVPTMNISALLGTSPSCYSNDGEIIAIVTGGTGPYYFSGSNGETSVTFSTSYTFTGLSAGYFTVTVTDAGLCNNTASTTLLTPNSFTVLSITTTNSTCNNNGGSIDILLLGGSSQYTYSLTDSLGNTTSVVIGASNYSFQNLSSGTYTLSISNGGGCTYTQNYTINNTDLFTLSASTVGTTCDNNDGSVTLTITSGGTPPFLYQIDGQSVTTSLLSYTFSGLSSGNYIGTVTDTYFCQQLINFFVPSSNSINFNLAGVGPTLGLSNGSLYTFITSGEPPFTLDWSDNVPTGQTGTTITGLTAGTYSLTISDDNGCVQSRDVSIYGINQYSSYELFNVCNSTLDFTGKLSKRGIKQYLIDGFFDLTSGDTGCIINQTIFELEATLTGTTLSEQFFTGTTLFDYPSDNEMAETLQTLLLQFNGVNTVSVDYINNTLIVGTTCNPAIGLVDATLSVSLKIYYDINCVSCS